MPRSHPLFTLLPLTITLACGDSGPAESDSTTAATTTVSTSNGATSATAGETDTGGASHEICDRYIACVAVTNPMGLPAAQQGFGSESECWKMSPSDIDLCLQACEAGLIQTHVVYPDEPKCFLCSDDSECDQNAGEHCLKGKCGTCGDGLVQAGELCDGQGECSDDCLTGDEKCSPLTGVGCPEGKYCTLGGSVDFHVESLCLTEPNECITGVNCGLGDYCYIDVQADIFICLPWCDLAAPEPCPDGLKCVKYSFGSVGFDPPSALSYLGKCE